MKIICELFLKPLKLNCGVAIKILSFFDIKSMKKTSYINVVIFYVVPKNTISLEARFMYWIIR